VNTILNKAKNNLRNLDDEKSKQQREESRNAVSHTLAKRCGVFYPKLEFGNSTDSRQ
jgi:hypothetical protein